VIREAEQILYFSLPFLILFIDAFETTVKMGATQGTEPTGTQIVWDRRLMGFRES
jgi:hypothetical protein